MSDYTLPRLIDHRSAWTGADIAALGEWIVPFEPEHLAEIDQALMMVEGAGLGLGEFGAADFPLPAFGEIIARTRDHLQSGLGFEVYRGFPVERYSGDQLRLIYWGIGAYLGTAVSQSKHGDLLGDVWDLGVDTRSATGRGYTSNAELSFHGDGCDVTGLFCLKTAKSGGTSRLLSAMAVNNAMAREAPDLLERVYEPFIWSRRGQERPGEPAWYHQPIYASVDGHFVCRQLRNHIEWGEKISGIPLTSEQVAALDLLDEIAERPGMALEKEFQPGDMQFSNNFRILHARTAYLDHDDPADRRHLLRLWLSVPNSPPLPESFRHFYREIAPGAVRGGNLPHEDVTYRTTR